MSAATPVPSASLAAAGRAFEVILERCQTAEQLLLLLVGDLDGPAQQAVRDAIEQWVVPTIAAAAQSGCELVTALELAATEVRS